MKRWARMMVAIAAKETQLHGKGAAPHSTPKPTHHHDSHPSTVMLYAFLQHAASVCVVSC